MSKNIFYVDNVGSEIINFSDEFEKMMDKQGYENPFWRRMQRGAELFENFKQNSSTDAREWLVKKPLPVTHEETQPQVLTPGKLYISVEDYIQQRDEYVIKNLYAKYGITDKIKDYIISVGREDLLKELKPCMAGDGQCSLFCPDYPCSIAKEKEKEKEGE